MPYFSTEVNPWSDKNPKRAVIQNYIQNYYIYIYIILYSILFHIYIILYLYLYSYSYFIYYIHYNYAFFLKCKMLASYDLISIRPCDWLPFIKIIKSQ